MVADNAIMGDMGIGHKQVVVADLGKALVLLSAAVHRGEFPNRIAVANFKPSYFGSVFLILRIFTNRGELVDSILLSDGGRAFDDDMRTHHRSRPDRYLCTDIAVRPYLNILGQFSLFVDNGGWMNQNQGTTAAQRISALATKSPSTSALQSNAQILRLLFRNFASNMSWSPGTTGRLNLALSIPTK